jgi:hypothetical protein
MTGEGIRQRFEERDEDEVLLNLLDLKSTRENPVPDFMLDLKAYSAFLRLKKSGRIGKNTDRLPTDLSGGSEFGLFAAKGVSSFTHIDHCG